jgi:hypothetical protein
VKKLYLVTIKLPSTCVGNPLRDNAVASMLAMV